MLKISLVLCMVAFTTIGCAASRQTKIIAATPVVAKAKVVMTTLEEITDVKKDVSGFDLVYVTEYEWKVVSTQVFTQPTTVTRYTVVYSIIAVDGSVKTETKEYLKWWDSGREFRVGLRSEWMVAYFSSFIINVSLASAP